MSSTRPRAISASGIAPGKRASGHRLPSRAYHVTDVRNWPSIERHGLLSTSRLLAMSGMAVADRRVLSRKHRPRPVEIAPGIIITDQHPMPPAALERCLPDGCTPEDWYALLNSRVFFWFDPARLERQRRAIGAAAHVVLTMDVAKLLERHADRVALTPINTGAAMRRPALRGPASFVPLVTWRESGWASEAQALGTGTRSRSHRPAELTVADAVPDALECAVAIRHLAPGEPFLP